MDVAAAIVTIHEHFAAYGFLRGLELGLGIVQLSGLDIDIASAFDAGGQVAQQAGTIAVHRSKTEIACAVDVGVFVEQAVTAQGHIATGEDQAVLLVINVFDRGELQQPLSAKCAAIDDAVGALMSLNHDLKLMNSDRQ
ncbi:hypothetical protein QCD79_05415 [Pseudomonas quasicaspiana]|nr:hypothetical protein [Pseudomonas quasicaspiana]